MSDTSRLVEQARERMDDPRWSVRVPHDALRLLAGLADEVERLQRDNDLALRAMGEYWEERDAARARVAALEAALRPLVTQLDDWYSKCRDEEQVYTAPAGEHWGMDTAIQEGGWKPAYALGDVRAAAALLDGRVPSTGQETT